MPASMMRPRRGMPDQRRTLVAVDEKRGLSLFLPLGGGEQAVGADGDAAEFQRAADAVGLARSGLVAAREVEELLRPERVAGGVADHHDARLQALLQVLGDDDAHLAAIELDDAPQRIDADEADELLDE